MKPFEYFIRTRDVRRITKDPALAKSLIKDMLDRINKTLMLDLSEFSKIIFENTYDALRDFADALLAVDGFKSYSHQASFSYLAKYNFSISAIDILDKFRFKRNSSKYYGYIVSATEAKEISKYYDRTKDKINAILKKKELI